MPRQLLIGLGALLATALVIGGTISVVALGAANLAGVGSAGSASEELSLYRPTTAGPSPEPQEPVESAQPDEPESAPAAKPPSDKPEPKRHRNARGGITLNASPGRASTYQHIYLTGTYRGGAGVTLQVQRFEGRWVDFPASATIHGGTFDTYVESGQDGENKFRVLDQSTGRVSDPASVILH